MLLEREATCRETSYIVQAQDQSIAENRAIQNRHQLARLYRSLSEMDVCSNIAMNWFIENADSPLWKEGCLAEVNMQWEFAVTAYDKALDVGCGHASEFCQEGLLKVKKLYFIQIFFFQQNI